MLAIDAPGTPLTHTIEVYSVSDEARALADSASLEGVEWVGPVFASAQSLKRAFVSDEVIVQLAKEADLDAVMKEWTARGFEIVETPLPSTPGPYLLRHPEKNTAGTLDRAKALMDLAGIEWAEPNLIVELELYSIPNDVFFGRQQGLHNTGQNGGLADADVDAPEAWDLRLGNEQLVIAIIDSGVDTGHPDLNIFRNPREYGDGRENNGVDNDGNGRVDDWQGWDFYGNDNNPNPGTSAAAAHGTACAGIAAARGNNSIGVAGAARGCRILPVKILGDDGSAFISNYQIGQAIRYAAQSADVISCSWGWPIPSTEWEQAINYATSTSCRGGKGCAVFCASGNGGSPWGVRTIRVPFSVTLSGTYRIAFRFISSDAYMQSGRAVWIDQVRLLGQDGYNHVGDPSFLLHEDFESEAAGWTVEHNGVHIADWIRAQPYQSQRPDSQWCFTSTENLGVPGGEWSELQSPGRVLQTGNYFICYMSMLNTWFVSTNQLEVWLLDAGGGRTMLARGASGYGGGSGGGGALSYPAAYAASIAIGACEDLGVRSSYSQFAAAGLFAVAPSSGGWNDVVTTDTRGAAGWNDGAWNGDGDYTMSFGGTSAATPLAAGVGVLVLSKSANLTVAQLKDSLRLGCEQIGGVTYDANGWHQEYGYGRVNARNSLQQTASDTTAPTVSSVAVRTGRAVEITFSEPTGDGVTVAANYTISGAGQGTLPAHPASITMVSGNKFVLEWAGGGMLSGSGNVTVTASSAVKDVAGNPMASPNSGTGNGLAAIYLVSPGYWYGETQNPIYPFEPDRYWSPPVGTPYGNLTVDSVLNDDGTPLAVYRSERCVLCSSTYPGDIVYRLPGITPGLNHKVRLYFIANGYSIYSGDVVFSVYINDVLKLGGFNLIGAAGGVHVGIWREFSNITADAAGLIRVRIVPQRTYNRTWGGTY